MTEDPNRALDALLARAGAAPPPPLPPAFQARLLADALAAQAQAAPRAVPRATRPSRLRLWLAELGGLPGVAGLGAAGIAGLWLGLAGPLPGTELAWALGDTVAALSPALAEFLDPLTATPFDDFTRID